MIALYDPGHDAVKRLESDRGLSERIHMRILACVLSLSVMFTTSLAAAQSPTTDIKIISSAGARAMADACTAWAVQNKQVVAMAILDWGGNLIESHAMDGAAANAIDTALLKAKSALRWRRATSETNKIV